MNTNLTYSPAISVDPIFETSLEKITELREHPKSIDILKYLSEKLTSERLQHVLSVQETAISSAKLYDVDLWKVHLAALLHDVAKWMSDEQLYTAAERYNIELDPIERIMPALMHAIVGVKHAIELFSITDLEILEAIRNHTTGSASMGIIAKLIFVADFSEPTRTYKEAALVRKLAQTELDKAVHSVARYKIDFLLNKGWIIHPNTIHTYNNTLV